MNLYFVRHGETKGNKEQKFRGRTDYPLNKNGKIQAKNLRNAIENINFNKIFSSPLKRAYQTAKIISSNSLTKIIKNENINNIDVGDWGGLDKNFVKNKYPKLWSTWINNPENIKFPNGENISDLVKRTNIFLENIKKYPENNILVVTHRSVLKCLFANLLNIKNNFFWKFYFNNASYSLVEYSQNRGFTIINTNNSNHLNNFVKEKK